MSEAIIVAGMHTLTIEEIVALKAFVAKVKDTFMTEGVHYMVFGEGDKSKNMLIKPGIEVLLMAFRLSPVRQRSQAFQVNQTVAATLEAT